MKRFVRPTLMAAAAAAALGMTAGASAAQSSKSASTHVDKAKASYVVGWDLASQLPPIVRDEVEPAEVAKAVQAALSGKKPTMSEAQMKSTREAFVTQLKAKAEAAFKKEAAKNKAEGQAFLAKNKTKPGVKTTASGLQYKVIKQGTGPHPGPNDTVEVNYVGKLLNGETFDDSKKHKGGGPADIPLSNVIPGFREGLQLMQVGGHYKLYIPSDLAYGAQPSNPMPPNSTLIFDVELLKTTPSKNNDSGSSDSSGQ
ncbi:FKBP-type peptidyl-prolyl cis-trans isomerase [Oleiagrimonas sp. C23AA]|uniref:FKBP-type peptidyl-prolyl cis-trans isomerase N-terminal domain-containing protein n=1 Tax=Oleiagrimonas sp. C23AA TaxID=2719047 RepID=UPI0014245945|nr:FKBP-type peptidyl-prolyl cis-trans isomerase [Oleiagrimonas sp. C23AA]NII10380.1 FKBP-type peptidyl-prolyl cis-trans isomerase [Oleiagrimonas sp. C23AA]